MDRRCFLTKVGQLPLLAAAGMYPWTAARASVDMGDATLTSISDGSLVLPATFFFAAMPQDELLEIRQAFDITGDQITPPCNAALLQMPGRTVLFDVGAGQEFMPSAGTLIETLDSLGIAPGDITDVVFTHAHPDHLWGLLDDFGDPAFTEARFYMGQTEFDYWMNPNTVDQIGEARAAFAVGAKRRIEMIADNTTLIRDGDEILPGVAARATFGHTPGHMAFEVRRGTEATMILGDSIANHHVAFLRPDWHSGADQDPSKAAQTRQSLLDQLAHEQIRIMGYHLPYGGMGRVVRKNGTYSFVAKDA